MILHELPDDVKTLHSSPPGVEMTVISRAVHHLLAPLTAGPDHAAPALHPVHVGLVVGALRVAVHAGDQVLDVCRLLQKIISSSGDDRAVRTLAQVPGSVSRVGNSVVQIAVKVDDVDGRVWPGTEASEW